MYLLVVQRLEVLFTGVFDETKVLGELAEGVQCLA